MLAAWHIPAVLAQDASDYNIIIFIVVAVLLAVSSWIKRAAEKKQEQEAAARRKDAQAQPEGEKRPAASGQQQVRRPAAPPELPSAEPQRIVRLETLGEDLDQGLRKEEQRLRLEDKRRQERLAVRKSPEADSAAIGQRLAPIRSRLAPMRSRLAQPEEISSRSGSPGLRSRELARSAIIYHVILSPPKALQGGPEMWDR